jgi:aspartyl/glutamyl-tRNA(Asn/Gln) amidotransferase C subunit
MKFDVDYFARLARIKLTAVEKRKLERELNDILSYIEELKSVDVKDVVPMAGGTSLHNAYREDVLDDKRDDSGKGRGSFPEEKGGFLKVPRVFE